MKKLLANMFLFVMIFSFNSYSQSINTYLPLHIDNEWTFSFQDSLHTEKIIDTTRINGQLYYGLSIWSSQPQYWLRESNDSIIILDTTDNTELLLYNFNVDTGKSWELIPEFNCWLGGGITLSSKNDTVVAPAGTFTDCYHFTHRQYCADAGVFDSWFAKGIGRVRYLDDNIAGTKDYKLVDYKIFPTVKVDEKLPVDISYSLFQNYPNPFNPSTSIQYAIISRQIVQLKVYDVLGNEIATLVNEEKPAGIYEVEFSATSGGRELTSGVYFYKLQTENYSSTKKMILLR
ncbi:MAG: T9SS type A sorting domain-containing protein [Ignavibacteriaceae bacterium]